MKNKIIMYVSYKEIAGGDFMILKDRDVESRKRR